MTLGHSIILTLSRMTIMLMCLGMQGEKGRNRREGGKRGGRRRKGKGVRKEGGIEEEIEGREEREGREGGREE